jgi:hypothetical protein
MRAADVDDDLVLGQTLPEESDIDDQGRAMQPLRRTEQFAAKTMGDHDVIADLDGIHGFLLADFQ